jgi:hypothetical protein
MQGEHKVHPYVYAGTVCRGKSCIRPYYELHCLTSGLSPILSSQF